MGPLTVVSSGLASAFRARKGGRVMALERYPTDRARLQAVIQNVVQAAPSADALFLPGDGDMVPAVVQVATLHARGRASGLPRLQWADGAAWLAWTDVEAGAPAERGAVVR